VNDAQACDRLEVRIIENLLKVILAVDSVIEGEQIWRGVVIRTENGQLCFVFVNLIYIGKSYNKIVLVHLNHRGRLSYEPKPINSCLRSFSFSTEKRKVVGSSGGTTSLSSDNIELHSA
jgi:hypothetical protein